MLFGFSSLFPSTKTTEDTKGIASRHTARHRHKQMQADNASTYIPMVICYPRRNIMHPLLPSPKTHPRKPEFL